MPCIILHRPQIPPNTGNIIRLSANCGFDLHLIEPLGFSLDQKSIKRAGMDYRELTHLSVHKSLDTCLRKLQRSRLVIVSTRGTQNYHRFDFCERDALLFGNEGEGLPEEVWNNYADAPALRLPMHPGCRSMNLANAAAIVAYACWQYLGFAGAS